MLAEPLRLPRYTVMPMPRSRWYSSVSTSPSRAVTDRPVSTLTPDFGLSGAEVPGFVDRERDQRLQIGCGVAEFLARTP